MDSYFQVRDAERTAWFTSQEVRNIADVAAMVTKALDAAGGEGETSVQALADHGGISLRPISADRFSAQVRTFSVSRPESSWQSWTSKMTHSTAPAGFRGRNTASRSPE